MNRRRFQIGPGAASLILIIVVLSMSVLGVMALMNARSDVKLSDRSLSVTGEVYALNGAAEESLAGLDAVLAACAAEETDPAAYLARVEPRLPEGMTLDGDMVSWTEEGAGGRVLECAVQLTAPGDAARFAWVRHELVVDTEKMGFDEIWN